MTYSASEDLKYSCSDKCTVLISKYKALSLEDNGKSFMDNPIVLAKYYLTNNNLPINEIGLEEMNRRTRSWYDNNIDKWVEQNKCSGI